MLAWCADQPLRMQEADYFLSTNLGTQDKQAARQCRSSLHDKNKKGINACSYMSK